MNLIERYAVEARVWGHVFLKGSGVANIFIYMYKEIDRYNLWKPGFIQRETPYMQGYNYRIYYGYIKPGIERNSIFRHDIMARVWFSLLIFSL